MSDVLKTLLLIGLPASGKSELRKYLGRLNPQKRSESLHLGPTVQIDETSYIQLMRSTDEMLIKKNQSAIFFIEPSGAFTEPKDWGTLIHLLNEDYADLVNLKTEDPTSHGYHLLERFDRAGEKVGIQPRFAALDAHIRQELAEDISPLAESHLISKQASYPADLTGRTIVLEFSRGGPEGSNLPLEPPLGYRYSLSQLSPDILENSAVLYVWITPEEARAKTEALEQSQRLRIPANLMSEAYGCDDISWLEETSDKSGTIKVETEERCILVPLVKLDNRGFFTDFLQTPAEEWPSEKLADLYSALSSGFETLADI